METSFTEDLEADSLDLVEVLMKIEESFEDELTVDSIPDEDAESLTTIRAAVDWILDHLKTDN